MVCGIYRITPYFPLHCIHPPTEANYRESEQTFNETERQQETELQTVHPLLTLTHYYECSH